MTAILQLLAATPVINRIPRKAEDSEEVYVWHESCNVNRSQEESLREPLRVSTALAEVVRGKRAVEDARERIMLIKAELKAPGEVVFTSKTLHIHHPPLLFVRGKFYSVSPKCLAKCAELST